MVKEITIEKGTMKRDIAKSYRQGFNIGSEIMKDRIIRRLNKLIEDIKKEKIK